MRLWKNKVDNQPQKQSHSNVQDIKGNFNKSEQKVTHNGKIQEHFEQKSLQQKQLTFEEQQLVKYGQKQIRMIQDPKDLKKQGSKSQAESQKDQERLVRLKLREEERIRRANGLVSAYEDHKEPLPMQHVINLKENINLINHTVSLEQNYPKLNVDEDYLTRNSFLDKQTSQSPNLTQLEQRQKSDNSQLHSNNPIHNKQFNDEKQYNNFINHEDYIKTQKNLAEKQKQKIYKEELDQQINLKRASTHNFKPYSQQTTQVQNPLTPQDDFLSKFGAPNRSQRQQNLPPQKPILQPNAPNDKSKYANELMEQLVNKERDQTQAHFQDLSDQQRQQIKKMSYKEELDRQIENNKQIKGQDERNFRKNSNFQFEDDHDKVSHTNEFQNERQTSYRELQKQNHVATAQNYHPNNHPYQLQQPYQSQQQFKQQQSNLKYSESNDASYTDTDIPQIMLQQDQPTNTFARKLHFSNNIDLSQVEKQKYQKQKYAEELKQQVEERTRIKKDEEKKYQEQDRVEQMRQQKVIEDQNKLNEQKEKSKQVEIFNHQVQNKNGMRRCQERSKQAESSLVQQLHQKKLNDEDKQSDQQRDQQRDQSNIHDKVNPQIQPVIQNQQLQPFQLQIQPSPQQTYENLLELQQCQIQPAIVEYQDQINKYQNVLFNPNTVPVTQHYQMQIHQNYLLQLQQSKQEIEIVRQILEEKLRIQQMEIQNQILVEQYKIKVKDISSEQILFEKEIQKLQQIITNKNSIEPLNPHVFTSALYMSSLGQGIVNQNIYQNPQQLQMNQQNDHNLLIASQIALPSNTQIIYGNHHLEQQQESMTNQQQEDIELPASSAYVSIQNNSIWQNLKLQENKSYMGEFQDIKRNHIYPYDSIEQSHVQIYNDDMEDQSLEQDNAQSLEESHMNVDGFDVNMLRTQDYLNMFKANIQSQTHDKNITNMLQKNSKKLDKHINKPLFQQMDKVNSQEFSQVAQDFIIQSNITSNQLPQSQMSNAVSQFQSKTNYLQASVLSSVQENYEEPQHSFSYLAVSGTIPLSDIQKAQELIMSDAKFSNEANSIILPDDDFDESKIYNFIESNDVGDQKYQKINYKIDNDKGPVDDQIYQQGIYEQHDYHQWTSAELNDQASQKPNISYNQPQVPKTPISNYMTGRSDQESISSKKYKRPKTFDIFSKQKQTTSCKNLLKSQKTQNPSYPQGSENKLEIIMTEPQYYHNQSPQRIDVHGSSNDNFNDPMYSNFISLPMPIQTTQIVQDRRSENIMNRLDNFLSQMVEQSQDQYNSNQQQKIYQSKPLIANEHQTTPRNSVYN